MALSDERAEYLIKDRLSFMRFLGLGLSRSGAGREHDPDVSRGADMRGRGRAAVRGFRCDAQGGRIPDHGRADRRRLDRGGAEAAQQCGETAEVAGEIRTDR